MGRNISDLLQGLTWFVAVIFVIIMGVGAALYIRKNLKDNDTPDSGDGGTGFSLSDLRKMRDDGRLSESEFEAAKQHLVQKAKSELNTPKPKDKPKRDV